MADSTWELVGREFEALTKEKVSNLLRGQINHDQIAALVADVLGREVVDSGVIGKNGRTRIYVTLTGSLTLNFVPSTVREATSA